MPYIKIQITNEGVTKEKKEQLIRETTNMMVSILNKDPASTFVVIEEVDTENWGVSGISVAELRKLKT